MCGAGDAGSVVGGGTLTKDARAYIAIDLKSFYASVECQDLGRDPLTTHLVVADRERTSKTICLAVSPSLKEYGLPGRARLFEVEQRIREVNAERRLRAPGRRFVGSSTDAGELASHPELAVDFIAAKPRMSRYLDHSARIYGVYLKYAAPEHIHVYSIDEVFVDATPYLRALKMTPHELATVIVRDIAETTGITATAGIGTNLYLAKVAMDIVAKHVAADEQGVRVAELDEMSYRRLLWEHRPITDFWRVGRGYAKKLAAHGLDTMGDIARCSLGRASDYHNEDLLYRLFGVNAELLIDHAWGWESCTMADIKAYKPEGHSISSGQVLQGPADFDTARLIVREMADAVSLDLVGKGLVARNLGLMVGYDISSLDPAKAECGPVKPKTPASEYRGPVAVDHYGRRVPKPANSSCDLGGHTASSTRIREAMMALYDRIVDPSLLVRRVTVVAAGLATRSEADAAAATSYEQPDLFDASDDAAANFDHGRTAGGMVSDGVASELGLEPELESRRRMVHAGNGSSRRISDCGNAYDATERNEAAETEVQRAIVDITHKFGRGSVIKGMNLEPGATGLQRNRQIGGHAA
ncbi:Y-family DNA polymerase [Bifidobacterium eulemuris]|uniref:Type VI secretion protein ImpB n=1 Tax=Bifidobacterium eulemuris TaxID=1765219 RepID=A0A261G9U7_9BIFI|nr:type VI secretion protein ImpB [Bifidobacterium eulemuris]QOL33132.1 type VI secretion protein ImpB [Bifidobacterium eulemuris]